MPKNKKGRVEVEPFRWESNDPLAAEHATIEKLLAEALKAGGITYPGVNLDQFKTGNKQRDIQTIARFR